MQQRASGQDHAKERLATQPLLLVLCLIVIGITLHRVPLSPALALTGLLGVLICGASRPTGIAWLARASGVLLTGILIARLDYFYFPHNHIALFASDEPRLARVEVRVDEMPQVVYGAVGRGTPPGERFEGSVLRVKTWRRWEAASGSLAVSVGQVTPGVEKGAVVEVLGMLQTPPRPANPGQPDWYQVDRRRRVLAELHVSHASAVRLVRPASTPILSGWRVISRDLLGRGFGAGQAIDRELLAALLFGDRGPEFQPLEQRFSRVGCSYLLSSSGLRIGVCCGCIYLLAALLRIGPRRTLLLVIACTIGFALTITPSIQALRPIILCTAVATALLLGGRVAPLQLLALAATLILIIDPLDLYSAGFQLSFITCAGLILLVPVAQRWLDELRDPDVVAAGELLEMTVTRRLARIAWGFGRQGLLVSLIAWVVSVPLVAYHFQQINPLAVLCGLLMWPLVLLCMVGAVLKLVLTVLLPPAAAIFAAPVALAADALIASVNVMARLPLARINLAPPSPLVLVAYYGLLLLPLVIRRATEGTSPSRWLIRLGPVSLGLCLVLSAAPVAAAFAAHRSPALRLTLLSVGAGQCAVVETAEGKTFLLDCGSSSLADPLSSCIDPFLRYRGCNHVDGIYLSHGDFDHINAAEGVEAEYGGAVLISPYFRAHATESLTAAHLLAGLDGAGKSPRVVSAGDRIDLSPTVRLQVVWPPTGLADLTSNNGGLVLKLLCAGRCILLPADIQNQAEAALLSQPQALNCDVLVAPHHGSREETTGAFVAACAPTWVLSSNASRLSKKQRQFDELPFAPRLYRTSRCGALTVVVERDGTLQVSAFRRLQPER